jgi:hypothetical protein
MINKREKKCRNTDTRYKERNNKGKRRQKFMLLPEFKN